MKKNVGNRIKTIAIITCTLLIATAFSSTVTQSTTTLNIDGNILYVGGVGPGNYTTIQEAIDDASNGDTVFVFDDSSPYLEHIEIDKSITLKGEDRETTIIDGCNEYEVVAVSADWVNISGFTVKNSGDSYYEAGIRLSSSKYTSISGNIIMETSNGIYLFYSSYNIITDNIVTNNTRGISLYKSPNNTVTENTFVSDGIGIVQGHGGKRIHHWNTHTIEDNTVNGRPIRYYKNTDGFVVPPDTGQLILANCTNFTIQNLIISDVDNGIQLGFSSYNTLINNNIIDNNDKGIYLGNSSNNAIIGNTITDNQNYGIYLWESSHNEIIENNIVDNYRGIKLDHFSNYTNITANVIRNNTRVIHCGIDLIDSEYNTITGNTITNHTDIIDPDAIYPRPTGINLHGPSNSTIIGNNITDNYDGIILLYSSDNNTVIIENNIANNNDAGIYGWVCHYETISGNNIANNNDKGIYLMQASNNTITGNHVTDNYNIGILLSEADRNNISGNTIANNNHAGISLKYSHHNNIISGNTIINHTDTGIHLYGSSYNNITGNIIKDNNRHGIYLDVLAPPPESGYEWSHASFSNIVLGNFITNNNENGIYLNGSSNNDILENTITDNHRGIHLDRSKHPYGYWTYESQQNTISGNIITENNDKGIYLKDLSSCNTIERNTFSNNKYGIWHYNSSDNNIIHNNFLNNRLNAFFYNSTAKWNNNYWNRLRVLPKPIFGIRVLTLNNNLLIPLPWINLDLHPAIKPYEIP